MIKFILIIYYTICYMHNIKFNVDCAVDIESMTVYSNYYCAHTLAKFSKILVPFCISLSSSMASSVCTALVDAATLPQLVCV